MHLLTALEPGLGPVLDAGGLPELEALLDLLVEDGSHLPHVRHRPRLDPVAHLGGGGVHLAGPGPAPALVAVDVRGERPLAEGGVHVRHDLVVLGVVVTLAHTPQLGVVLRVLLLMLELRVVLLLLLLLLRMVLLLQLWVVLLLLMLGVMLLLMLGGMVAMLLMVEVVRLNLELHSEAVLLAAVRGVEALLGLGAGRGEGGLVDAGPGRVRHEAGVRAVLLRQPRLLLLLDLLLQRRHRGVDLVLALGAGHVSGRGGLCCLGISLHPRGRGPGPPRPGRGEGGVEPRPDLLPVPRLPLPGRHALHAPQRAGAAGGGARAEARALQLLDAVRHARPAPRHHGLLRAAAVRLLVAVEEVRRGRGEELHAAARRGGVALPRLRVLAAHRARCPPGGRGRLAAHLAAAPPQQSATPIHT